MRCVIVNSSGTVESSIMWDGKSDWTPPEGCQAIQSDSADIGYTYNAGEFSPPTINQLALSSAQQWADYQAKAQALLDKTSVTMERIIEGVSLGSCALTNSDVITFMTYRHDLRAIVKATLGDPTKALPIHPGYPSGT